MEFPNKIEEDLPRDVASRTSISNLAQAKSILARRKRMEIRRVKLMMNGSPEFLDSATKHPRLSSSEPEELPGKTPEAEAKLVILIEEGDGICGRVDVDILSSAPVRLSGQVSEMKGEPAPSVLRSGSLQVEGRSVDTKASMVMGAVSINALAVIDRDSACGSFDCSCNGQRNPGVLEAVCFCVKASKAPSQNRSNAGDLQNVKGSEEESRKARDRGGEETVGAFPPSMCEISSEEGNTRARDDSCPPHSLVSLIGRRREMEDAAVAVPSFVSMPSNVVGDSSSGKNTALHFFGVYDGHGGSQAAVFCKDRLHAALAEDLNESINKSCGQQEVECGGIRWQQIMASCFLRIDAEIGGICPRGAECQRLKGNPNCCTEPSAPETVGTTAVVAVLSPSQIVVANCGDSRAVLIKGGIAIALSQDHKPDRPDELERIEAAGGRVIYWNGNRVLGILAMSRALGDRYMKPYIIPDPDVICMRRSDDDECLIIASDGLWEVLSEDEVRIVTRKCLKARGWRKAVGLQKSKEAEEDESAASASAAAAALLTKLALARGSTDNISVVVVDLRAKSSNNR